MIIALVVMGVIGAFHCLKNCKRFLIVSTISGYDDKIPRRPPLL